MEIKNKVEYIDIKKLNILKNNPRKISEENFEKLKKSIKENKDYFEARPIICSDRTNKLVILAGNQRYRACLELGIERVPIVILKNLTEEKEKEIIIRDNVELGDWEHEILQENFLKEDLEEWGVCLENEEEIINEEDEEEIKNEEVDLNKKNVKIVFSYTNSEKIINIFLEEIIKKYPELINIMEIHG